MRLNIYHSILPIVAIACTFLAVQDQTPRYQQRDAVANEQARGIKGAFQYLSTIRSNVNTGKVEANDIVRTRKAALAAMRNQTKAVGLQWIEMGPDNIGGRTRTIVIDPTNSNTLYAGGVSGGLWKSTNGGNTWSQVTGLNGSLIVSTVAILGNGHIYVGTGSTFDFASGTGGSGFLGAGLFRSMDGGATFEQKFAPNVSFSLTQEWTEVDKLVADPNDGNRVWVAWDEGFGYFDEDDDFMTVKTDAGLNNGLPSNQRCTAIEISPDGQTMAIVLLSSKGYISQDGGQNFFLVSTGNGNPPTSAGRIEFAISPDDPNYIYVLVATNSGVMGGVFASSDRGNSWTMPWPTAAAAPTLNIFGDNGQGRYDNVISVIPGHPDEYWVGGVQLWKGSINGQPVQIAVNASFPGCFVCVHSDVHEITWDPNNPNIGYVGTDGGVYKTFDQGGTFFSHNRGYNVTQFYATAYSPQNKSLGGTQDNSTPYMNFEGNTIQEAVILGGGDGFDCDISQMDPNIVFGTSQNGVVIRSPDQGNSGGAFFDARINALANADGEIGDFYTNIRLFEDYNDLDSPDSTIVINNYTVTQDTLNLSDLIGQSFTFQYTSRKVPAVPLSETVIISEDMLPDTLNAGSQVYLGNTFQLKDSLPDRVESLFAVGFNGNQGVWVTRDALTFAGSVEWWKVLNTVGDVNCLEFSADGNHLFVGTAQGQVIRISGFDNAYTFAAADEPTGANYSLTHDVILNSGGAAVTGLGPDPNNVGRLLVTLGNYGGSQKVRLSTNATATPASSVSFSSIWNVPSNLQGMPVYDGIISAANLNIMVVGTEHGVMATDDAGATWNFENDGMDNVPVFAVRQQRWDANNSPQGATYIENPYVIFLGTHGRGMFRSETLLSVAPPTNVNVVEPISLNVYPNPMSDNGWLGIDLSERATVQVQIFDITGKKVRDLFNGKMAAGSQKLVIDATGLPSGTYIISAVMNDTRKVARFVKQ